MLSQGSLFILLTISAFRAVSATTTVPVISYGAQAPDPATQKPSEFSSVGAVPGNYSTAQCDTVSATNPQYSATSLSVSVTLSRDNSRPGCAVANSGLGAGAIAGIVIGVLAAATAGVLVAVILFRRRELNKRELQFRKNQSGS